MFTSTTGLNAASWPCDWARTSGWLVRWRPPEYESWVLENGAAGVVLVVVVVDVVVVDVVELDGARGDDENDVDDEKEGPTF